MAGAAKRKALKQQALQNLAEARHDLRMRAFVMRDRMQPRKLVVQTVARHPLIVLSGAIVAGFGIVRLIFPQRRQISRDSSSKTATKRTLAGIMLAGMWGVARGPLLQIATRELMPRALQYLSHLQTPSKPNPPE